MRALASRASHRTRLLAGKSLLLAAALWPFPVAAELSITCLYGVMTETYETMAFCGDHLEQGRITQYLQLRSELKDFINNNARSAASRIDSDYDQRIRNRLRLMTPDEICKKNPYYASFRAFFYDIMTSDRT